MGDGEESRQFLESRGQDGYGIIYTTQKKRDCAEKPIYWVPPLEDDDKTSGHYTKATEWNDGQNENDHYRKEMSKIDRYAKEYTENQIDDDVYRGHKKIEER